MKSLVSPLSSIAAALNRIAHAIESTSILKLKEAPKPNPTIYQPTTTTTSTPFKTKYYEYQSDTSVRISKKEKEVLDRIYNAIVDKGVNEMHHDKVMNDMRRRWPVLHAALTALVIARADEKSNLNKTNDSIWKHKNDEF